MKKITQNLGIIGLFLTAIVSPCCFPLFGFVLSAMGVSTAEFELFGSYTFLIFQILVLISLVSLSIAYASHRRIWILLLAIFSASVVFYGFDDDFNRLYIYLGMFGLFVSQIATYFVQKNKNKTMIQTKSTITCPNCGHQKTEIMPTDSCQFFYECENCKTIIKPKQGDCCVFCSYGSEKCPSIQMNEKCC